MEKSAIVPRHAIRNQGLRSAVVRSRPARRVSPPGRRSFVGSAGGRARGAQGGMPRLLLRRPEEGGRGGVDFSRRLGPRGPWPGGLPARRSSPRAPARPPRRPPPGRPRAPSRLRRGDRGAGDARADPGNRTGRLPVPPLQVRRRHAGSREGNARGRSSSPVPARRRPRGRGPAGAEPRAGHRLGSRSRQHSGQRSRPGRAGARDAGHGPPGRGSPDGALEEADRAREDGGAPGRQLRQRPASRLPDRRIPAAAREGDRGPGREGDHVRLRRHLDQAGALDGGDEVRHDGRRDGVRLRLRRETPETPGARRRDRSRDREPSERFRVPPRRHSPDAQREDRRGGQHRRRGAPGPGGRPLLLGEVPAGRPRSITRL